MTDRKSINPAIIVANLNPSLVILNEVKNLVVRLRMNCAKNLVVTLRTGSVSSPEDPSGQKGSLNSMKKRDSSLRSE